MFISLVFFIIHQELAVISIAFFCNTLVRNKSHEWVLFTFGSLNIPLDKYFANFLFFPLLLKSLKP